MAIVDTVLAGGSMFAIPNDGNDWNVRVLGDGTVVGGNGNDTVNLDGNGIVALGNGNDSVGIGNPLGFGLVEIGSGNDTVNLTEGGVILQNGAGGHDTITLGIGNDTLYESGVAQVSGLFGDATVGPNSIFVVQTGFGGVLSDEQAVSGNVTMQAGNNLYNEMEGRGGTNVSMMGGSGINIFDGGSGHDTMTGGGVANAFQFDANSVGGTTLITNFTSGHDTLYLGGNTLAFLQSQGDVTTSGGNTVITLDSGQTHITLQGVTNLHPYDVTTNHTGGG